MLVYTCKPSTGEAEDCCVLEASLDHILRPRLKKPNHIEQNKQKNILTFSEELFSLPLSEIEVWHFFS